jgi:endonuclease/exonuclease/phosphatase family metal-dependent hydrolase
MLHDENMSRVRIGSCANGLFVVQQIFRRWMSFPALGMLLLIAFAGCPRSTPPQTGSSNSALNKTSQADSPQTKNATESSSSNEFVIVAYNVENLFDIDGIALFEDYLPEKYGPAQLLVKLKNAAKVMATVNDGRGPEIILFQEFEADQTPAGSPIDYLAMLQPYENRSLESMLTEPIADEIKDLPAEVFLLKAFAEAGMEPYHVVVAEYRPDPTGRTVAHVNATFSQFPVLQSSTLQSDGARGTLEVVHDVHGHRLYTFNSHWKSGASNPAEEPARIGNAKVLRDRLNEILKADPAADIVLGGDFNSQYNQSQRFPKMRRTGINSVLKSQGNELAIRDAGRNDLYNLWYELPAERRASDAYQGYWGTLMNMMITRGLYDHRGVQYVDNSFDVVAIENVNAQTGSGLPLRWRLVDGQGTGFSDHLPVLARFQVVEEDDPGSYIQLTNPGTEGTSEFETKGIKARFNLKPNTLVKTRDLGSDEAIQKIELVGHIFLVDAQVTADKPLRIKLFNDEFKLWSFDEKIRLQIYDKYPVGTHARFYGELDFHDGRWQFLVHDIDWLEP